MSAFDAGQDALTAQDGGFTPFIIGQNSTDGSAILVIPQTTLTAFPATDGTNDELNGSSAVYFEYWGLFGPAGTTWSLNTEGSVPDAVDVAGEPVRFSFVHGELAGGDTAQTDTGFDKTFFSIGALPQEIATPVSGTFSPTLDGAEANINWDLFETYRSHAYAFVLEDGEATQMANPTFDPDTGMLNTDFSVTTTLMESQGGDNVNSALVNLPPGQAAALTAATGGNTVGTDGSTDGSGDPFWVSTPVGKSQVYEMNSWTTERLWQGVMPTLPSVADAADNENIRQILIDEGNALIASAGEAAGVQFNANTYLNGFPKLYELIQIADALGENDIRDWMIEESKLVLSRWFSADSGQFFMYNSDWNSMIGYPEAFGSGWNLNDHHFHWSYMVQAAATIGRYDQEWFEQYAPMVELLIRDVANWEHNRRRQIQASPSRGRI